MIIAMRIGAPSNPTEAAKKNRDPGLQNSRNFRLEGKIVNIVSNEHRQRIFMPAEYML